MDILRRCAALIAAYAVALQMVLSAFAAAAPLAAGFAICRGDSATAPTGDIAHDPCAGCVAHCAGAGVPGRDAVALTWCAAAAPTGQSSARSTQRAPPHAPHSPRAPPFS